MKDGFAAALAFAERPENDGQRFHVTAGDPGGATAYGVTLHTAQDYAHRHGLPPVTLEQMMHWTPSTPIVAAIMRRDYWDVLHCEEMPAGLDLLVFDQAVVAGASRTAKMLQAVLGVTEDGIVGEMTLSRICRFKTVVLIQAMHDARESFYAEMPTWHLFGRGWDRRTDDERHAALDEARGLALAAA